jgi:signal transduction histidine kinase
MSRIRSSIAAVAAGLLLWTAAVPAEGASRRVLLLYSYEREFSHFTFARLFRPELSRSSPDPIEFIELSLQTVRSSLTESDDSILDDLRDAFGSRRFDLVVPIGGPAAAFVQKYGDRLFAQVPVLLAAVDSRFVQSARLSANETAVMARNDPPRMIESILSLLPDTKTVVVIIGASRLERFWLEEVRRSFRRFDGRLNFIWTDQLSFAELLRRCGTLPPHSAILYGILSLDATGAPQMEEPTLDALHAVANAPLFGLHSHQLGHGIVGGPLLSLPELSHDSAGVALRLLGGESAAHIAPVTLLAGVSTFDSRELRRWGISEARLQPGSVVEFRERGLWQRDRVFVAAIATFIGAQALLVITLAIVTVRRRRAAPTPQADDGVKAAEAALAKLSQRLMDAHEKERARIAKTIHEDVCQQMTALQMQLQALSHATGEGAAELRTHIERLCGQFSVLQRDVLAISDPVYARLQLLGLAPSARAFCRQRCTEQGITLSFQAAAMPYPLRDSVALAIFRVLQEALENVFAHAQASRVAVTLSERGGTIDLEVADDGVGFDSVVTMQRGTVGLVAMRERMRQVGGTLTVESRPGRGTRICARAPR